MSSSGIAARRTSDPDHARALVLTDGAAVLTEQVRPDSESWPDFGVRTAWSVLADDGIQIVPQFEASVASSRVGAAIRSTRDPDDPFLRRLDVGPDEDLWLHNDGYAVGDDAPDQLFLLCEQPGRSGGANVLIDTAILLEEIGVEDPQLFQFLIGTPIDQTEPAFDEVHAPVVRTLANGRTQVRRNPYQAALPGAPAVHAELIARWAERCVEAAATAPDVVLRRGDLACFDNYRVLHGRRPYVGNERTAHSIWGWSTGALAVLPAQRQLVF